MLHSELAAVRVKVVRFDLTTTSDERARDGYVPYEEEYLLYKTAHSINVRFIDIPYVAWYNANQAGAGYARTVFMSQLADALARTGLLQLDPILEGHRDVRLIHPDGRERVREAFEDEFASVPRCAWCHVNTDSFCDACEIERVMNTFGSVGLPLCHFCEAVYAVCKRCYRRNTLLHNVGSTVSVVRQHPESSLAMGEKVTVVKKPSNAGGLYIVEDRHGSCQRIRPSGISITADELQSSSWMDAHDVSVALDASERHVKECSNCGEVFPPHYLKLCAGCKCARYCSYACQKTHWRVKHRRECANLPARYLQCHCVI